MRIWQAALRRFVDHQAFNHIITGLIALNVCLMMVEHEGQGSRVTAMLFYSNWFFTIAFVAEAVIKLAAMGTRLYLRDPWNRLDIFVVLTSVASLLAEHLAAEGTVSPAALRSLRVLRVIRVTKALRVATGVRSLLHTVGKSAGHVAHLCSLLLLLFFITAALAIEVFGRISCSATAPCYGLSSHANFKNIGMAMLTLFRIAT
eukprot:UC1_evm1s867